MTPEELHQKIMDIIQENCVIMVNYEARLAGIEANKAVAAIATFYEQTVLPKIVKGWKENVEAWETGAAGKGIEPVIEYYKKENDKLQLELESKDQSLTHWRREADHYKSQLSQLQSSMEEEKREAFEAAAEWINFKDIMQTNDGMWWRNNPAYRENPFAQSTEHLFDLYKREIKSTTQTEGK